MKDVCVELAGLEWGLAQRARALWPGFSLASLSALPTPCCATSGSRVRLRRGSLVVAVDGQQVNGDGDVVQLSLADAIQFGTGQ